MPIGLAKFAYQGYQVTAAPPVTRTPKTMTNDGATFSSGVKQFGSYSASFDGTNDKITTSSNADFALTGTSPFTVEFWMNTADSTAEIVGQQTYLGYDGWSVGLRSSQRVLFVMGDGGGSSISVLVPSTGNYTENVWQHVAVVCDGVGIAIFCNGTRTYHLGTWGHVGSQGTNDFQIGFGWGVSGTFSDTVAGTTYYNGYLDELRISTSERYDVSTSTLSVPTAPFVNDADTVLLMHFENNVNDDGG